MSQVGAYSHGSSDSFAASLPDFGARGVSSAISNMQNDINWADEESGSDHRDGHGVLVDNFVEKHSGRPRNICACTITALICHKCAKNIRVKSDT